MTNMRSLPLRVLATALFAAAFVSTGAVAQAVASQARITAPIDESELVTLKGNVHPAAIAQNDRGPVSGSFALPDLTLVLSRGPEQQAAFDAYVQSEYDSGSSNYHQWLTPAEIGTRFGPASSDIAAVTSWLTSHGFTVKNVSPDGMTIRFAGTASLVQSAFHTSIHNLSVNGVAHYANMTDPQIPAALSPVVVGIKALHNFLPHPLHREGSKVQFNKDLGKWQRVASTTTGLSGSKTPFASSAAASTGLRPQFGINVGSGSSAYLEEDVTPWDFATIYNLPSGWPTSNNGSGQTIAIAGTSEITQSDVTTFRSTFGLPALSGFQQIDTNGLATMCTSTNPSAACGIGDLDENTLDVEWSGAVAPGANIALVVTGQNSAGSIDTVYDSAQYVIQNQTAKILNVSYGECELFQGTTENVAIYDLWQTAAAEGISVFVAAGDSGSPSCDDGGDSIGWPYSAQYGLSVSGLASTPYNVAVGGTDFSWCKPVYNSSGNLTGCPSSSNSQGSTAYWNTSSSGNSSTEPYESALGYVPEIPWNDTCENPILASYIESLVPLTLGGTVPTNPEGACDWVQANWYNLYVNSQGGIMLAPYIDTVGGSGGASSCVSNNADTDANNPTCNTGATSVANGSGSIALFNNGWQKPSWQTGVTGIPNDSVRDLPDVSFFAGDGALNSAYLVCISAEGSSCTYSDTSENTAEEFGGTSFASPAMAGVMAIINQKAGAAQGLPNAELYKLAGRQTYSSCSAEGPPSSSCYFHSIDEGTNSMPCDLGASVGGAYYDNGWEFYTPYAGIDSPNCTALNSGDTVGTLVSSGTTPGYNATAGYNLATGLGSLNVANVVNAWTSDAGTGKATMTVTLTPSSGSITDTTALQLAVTVTGSGATPTGTIAVSGGGYSTSGTLSSGAITITIPAGSLAPGSDTLTVTYSGDSNYASTSTTESVSVAAAVPTVTISAPASDNVLNAVSVTVTVAAPQGGATPTGTASLSGGTYSSTAVTLSSTGTASFTIPAGDLPAGTDTLTANYSGSSTYATATGTTTILIVSTALVTPTIKVTPSSTSIDTSQSLSVTVTASGTASTGPTGTVTLTSSASSTSGASWSGPLSGSVATITIPSNGLNAGTDTITATYSGDANYAVATGTASVTVTASTYGLSATTPSAVSPGSPATSTISGQASSTDYSGTVTLNSCSLTSSSVSSPNSPPSCAVSGTITYASGTASGTGTATVSTTAASAELVRPRMGNGWLGAGSGAVLAVLVFFGIPARRRSWRAMLGMFVLLVALGSLAACGGSVSSGGSGTTSTPSTSAGTYTFTVTGVGNDPAKTTESTTFTVTVN